VSEKVCLFCSAPQLWGVISLIPMSNHARFLTYSLRTLICAMAASSVGAASDGRVSSRKHSLEATIHKIIAHVREGRVGVMKRTFPWYHSTDELQQQVHDLANSCNGMLSNRSIALDGATINVVNIKKPNSKTLNRVFMLFGEHSRELISPESGLRFLQMLCGTASAKGSTADPGKVLDNSEFEIVLNANPRSRRKVEDGSYCLRTNVNGVDLNRNWAYEWQATAMTEQSTEPGPRPFSEPETRIVRDLVKQFKPTTFVTVHSGTRGMYMPFAYDTSHAAARNAKPMMKLLKDIDERHCQCPYGAAGKEVGYSCPGTCLDWVYENLKTPYAFAFEIFTSPDREMGLKDRWKQKVASGGIALLQNGSHLGHPHFASLFETHNSDFVHRRSESDKLNDKEDFDCFSTYNPQTQNQYEAVVNNWGSAFLEMSHDIASDLQHRT